MSPRPPAAAAIRDVAYLSVSKFLKNIHVVRFPARAADPIAQLIKVIKELVKRARVSPAHVSAGRTASIAAFQGTYYSWAQDGRTWEGNWIHIKRNMEKVQR